MDRGRGEGGKLREDMLWTGGGGSERERRRGRKKGGGEEEGEGRREGL